MDAIKKKPPITRYIRRTIQIVSFIFLPGLFISVFSAIGNIYTSILAGSFSMTAQAADLLVLLAVIPVTILMGRFFCGFLCAFGSMGDFFWFVSRKIFKRRFKISAKTDQALKLFKYVFLLLLVVLVWTFGLFALDSTFSPWTIFGMYASVTGWPSAVYLLSIGAGLLLLIIAGSMLIERFFCRYLCPLGAVFTGLSRYRFFQIRKPRQQCGSCKICTVNCPMGIQLNQTDVVTSGDCIDCFVCTEVCPRGNVKANPTPAVAATLSVIAMTGLYYVGSLTNDNTVAAITVPTTVVTDTTAAQGQYVDGVYSGSAAGFKGTTEVQVTVANGSIANIQIVSTNDDARFFNKAKNTVISSILSLQSTQVDTVSGATFSSYAIIDAVSDALSTALNPLVSSTTAASSSAVSTTTATAAATAETSTAANLSGTYADGIYTGSGTGFRGTTTVSVTVAGNQITDITVDSYQDDARFFIAAQNIVISDILSQQSISVDTVSGATFSSNGLIEAVANALSVSFTNPNSTVGGGRGHGSH